MKKCIFTLENDIIRANYETALFTLVVLSSKQFLQVNINNYKYHNLILITCKGIFILKLIFMIELAKLVQ